MAPVLAFSLALAVPAFLPDPAHAVLIQGSQNWEGWCTVVPGLSANEGIQDCLYSSPLAACQAQYDWWARPDLFPQLYFIGYEDTPYWWYNKLCKWNWRPGWGVAPTSVIYHCPDPNVAVPPGRCVPPNESFAVRDICSVNGGGTPVLATPHPIEVLSGDKFLSASDFVTREPGLSLTRTFNSSRYGFGYSYSYYPFRGDPAGFANWTPDFAFEIQISKELVSAIGQVGLVTPEGGFYAFKKQSNGSLTPFMGLSSATTPQLDYSLELLTPWPSDLSTFTNSVSRWRMVGPDDGVWILETTADPVTGKHITARPISHTERGGQARTFTYGARGELAGITNQYGRSLSFTWLYSNPEDAGRTGPVVPRAISRIELPDGRRLVYTYEVVGTNGTAMEQAERLKTVELRDASDNTLDRTTYLYTDPRYSTNVTGIENLAGELRWQVGYDAFGRATSSSGPSGANLSHVAYGPPGTTFTRTVTNALGRQTTVRYTRTTTNYDIKLSAVEGQASPNAPAATASLAYGTDRLLSSFTDAEGRVTRYVRNARGLETSRTEGYGTPQARTITTTWHPTYRLPTEIVEPGLTTTFSYDAGGNLLTRTETDTTSQAVPYSTNGQQRTWTYSYTSQGLLDTVDGPLPGGGDTIDYDYDTRGLLATITDPAGNVTSVTAVDGAGRPLTVLNPNGIATALAYDDLGRLTSITENPGAEQRQTTFQYDGDGHVTQVTLPTGGTLAYTYDAAGRVMAIRNNFDEAVHYQYNTAGQVTRMQIEDAGAAVRSTVVRAYDEIGRLLRTVGAGSQTETYGYDRSDLQVSRTDPRSKTFTFAYDSVSRLIRETNPENQTTQLSYDGRNHLATHQDGRSLVTTFVRNGFGDVLRESSPDRGETTYWYDAAGRVVRSVDADGAEILVTYDAAGRLLAKAFTGSPSLDQTFSYDDVTGGNFGKGMPTGSTDAHGAASYRYDAFGRLTRIDRTIDGHSYQTGFTYDPLGNLATITYPSGREVRYVRDAQGRATAVETGGPSWTPVASDVRWLPFGPLASLQYGNGLRLDLGYDQSYWLGSIDVSGLGTTVLDLAFTRDAAGALIATTDAVAPERSATFTYTDSGRLETATGPWGSLSWLYDAAGNRTRETRGAGATTATLYSYPSTSNRLSEIRDDTNALVRRFTYRLSGRVSEDERSGAGVLSYDDDAAGRLQQVRLDGVVMAIYGYDAAGRRIARTVAGSPAVSREYLYFPDGRLMAEADGTGTIVREYVWLDDLPLAVADGAGAGSPLYYVHAGPRGEPLAMTDASRAKVWDAAYEPFGAATVFTATTALDLRLPGQQLQAETGLHQNWMRDYDPSLGRYVQPDPIGLAGGSNVYSYVGQDPLQYTDRDGQLAWLILPVLGGVIGGGIEAINQYNQYGRICYPERVFAQFAVGLVGGAFGAGLGVFRGAPLAARLLGQAANGAKFGLISFGVDHAMNPRPASAGEAFGAMAGGALGGAGGEVFGAGLGAFGGAAGRALSPYLSPFFDTAIGQGVQGLGRPGQELPRACGCP